MNFKYKIIEVHPELHSIVVRYYTDTVTEEYLAHLDSDGNPRLNEDGTFQRCKFDLNIQLWEIPPPTGDALHARIVECAPVHAMNLDEKIVNPEIDTELTEMTSLLGEITEGEAELR
jgi:hypothetical protein